MEPLFWILAGMIFVLWLMWKWGKESGLTEARQKEARQPGARFVEFFLHQDPTPTTSRGSAPGHFLRYAHIASNE